LCIGENIFYCFALRDKTMTIRSAKMSAIEQTVVQPAVSNA